MTATEKHRILVTFKTYPWVIVGVFPIPHDPQRRLFD